jgi:hypothetical protein
LLVARDSSTLERRSLSKKKKKKKENNSLNDIN